MLKEIAETVQRGPHVSAMVPEAMHQLQEEVAAKAQKGQYKVVAWESIKAKPPKEMKVSPIAMITHKSRQF